MLLFSLLISLQVEDSQKSNARTEYIVNNCQSLLTLELNKADKTTLFSILKTFMGTTGDLIVFI